MLGLEDSEDPGPCQALDRLGLRAPARVVDGVVGLAEVDVEGGGECRPAEACALRRAAPSRACSRYRWSRTTSAWAMAATSPTNVWAWGAVRCDATVRGGVVLGERGSAREFAPVLHDEVVARRRQQVARCRAGRRLGLSACSRARASSPAPVVPCPLVRGRGWPACVGRLLNSQRAGCLHRLAAPDQEVLPVLADLQAELRSIGLSWAAEPVLDPVLPQEGRELLAHRRRRSRRTSGAVQGVGVVEHGQDELDAERIDAVAARVPRSPMWRRRAGSRGPRQVPSVSRPGLSSPWMRSSSIRTCS